MHVHLHIVCGSFVHNSRIKGPNWRLYGLQNLKYVLYSPLQVELANPGPYAQGGHSEFKCQ